MDCCFQTLVEVLREACAQVKMPYFRLQVAGRQKQIYRERVYCYELYHQIRCLFACDFKFVPHGEVDKSNHPAFPDSKRDLMPDFIVHVPGHMDSNLAVMEVKPITARTQSIASDVCKIQRFLSQANYYRGIMLLYGESPKGLPMGISNQFTSDEIWLLWHKQQDEKPCVAWPLGDD